MSQCARNLQRDNWQKQWRNLHVSAKLLQSCLQNNVIQCLSDARHKSMTHWEVCVSSWISSCALSTSSFTHQPSDKEQFRIPATLPLTLTQTLRHADETLTKTRTQGRKNRLKHGQKQRDKHRHRHKRRHGQGHTQAETQPQTKTPAQTRTRAHTNTDRHGNRNTQSQAQPMSIVFFSLCAIEFGVALEDQSLSVVRCACAAMILPKVFLTRPSRMRASSVLDWSIGPQYTRELGASQYPRNLAVNRSVLTSRTSVVSSR